MVLGVLFYRPKDYSPVNVQIRGQKYTAPGSPGTTLFRMTTTTTTTTTIMTTSTTTTVGPTTTTTMVPAPPCGDPIDPSQAQRSFRADTVTASDALYILQAAIGTRSCEECTCDVDSSGAITATDALAVLRVAVGEDVELVCPACG
jgi:hypothetical protein